jgi:hypothetical protein
MAWCRPIVVGFLVAVWLATPALACLPNQQMSNAEMACCKKMAGDCHMGVGQHPCCKTVTSVDVPVATLQGTAQVHPPSLEFVVLDLSFQLDRIARDDFAQAHLGLPPPSPPGPNSILRI